MPTRKSQLNTRALPRTRRMWTACLKLAKLRGLRSADQLLSHLCRGYRLQAVRMFGAAAVAKYLGESGKAEASPFTGPPDRPRNVR